MKVGINGQKGRIVYRLTPSINHEIDKALAAQPELRDLSRNEQIQFVCGLIDQHIHAAYEIYPRGEEFDEYIDSRLQLIHLSNKDTDFLRTRLYEREYNKYMEELSSKRKTMVATGDRSEKVRTYNYPQSRVTDHRIGWSMHNLPAFMDGDIEDCIEALQLAENAEKLKASVG
jgi:hypothetical protein